MSTTGSSRDGSYPTLEEELYSRNSSYRDSLHQGHVNKDSSRRGHSNKDSSLRNSKCHHEVYVDSCHSCRLCNPKRDDKKNLTNAQKWWLALFLAILFVIISSPALYGITDGISRVICLPPTSRDQGPTLWGLLIHFIIFLLVIRLLLESDRFLH